MTRYTKLPQDILLSFKKSVNFVQAAFPKISQQHEKKNNHKYIYAVQQGTQSVFNE